MLPNTDMFKTLITSAILCASAFGNSYNFPYDDFSSVKTIGEIRLSEEIHIYPNSDILVNKDINLFGSFVCRSFVVLEGIEVTVSSDFTVITSDHIQIDGEIKGLTALNDAPDIHFRSFGDIDIEADIFCGNVEISSGNPGDYSPRGGQFFAQTSDFQFNSYIVGGKGADALPGMHGGAGGSSIVIGDTVGHTKDKNFAWLVGGNAGKAGISSKLISPGKGGDGGNAAFLPSEDYVFYTNVEIPFFVKFDTFYQAFEGYSKVKQDRFESLSVFSGNTFSMVLGGGGPSCVPAVAPPADGTDGDDEKADPKTQADQKTHIGSCEDGRDGNDGGSAEGTEGTEGAAGTPGSNGQDGGNGSKGGDGGDATSGHGEHGEHGGDCCDPTQGPRTKGGDGGDSGDANAGQGVAGGWHGPGHGGCPNGKHGKGGNAGSSSTGNTGKGGNSGPGVQGSPQQPGTGGTPGESNTYTPGLDGYVGAPPPISVSVPGTTGKPGTESEGINSGDGSGSPYCG